MKKKISFLAIAMVVLAAFAFARDARVFEVGGSPELDLRNVAGDITIRVGSSDQIVIKASKDDERVEVIMEQTGDLVTVETKYPEGIRNFKGGVDFDIEFPSEGRLTIESVSGSIDVVGVNGRLNLSTVSGEVSVARLEGDLELKSVSGRVTMNEIGSASAEASSTSGSIVYKNGDLAGGDYRFNSTSGSVKITHGEAASYRISGRTISGGITNDVGDEVEVIKQKYGPTQSVKGEFNGGETKVTVNTVSGSIVLTLN